MGRQVVKHLNSSKQGSEFIAAMTSKAYLNEIVVQHSNSGDTALWTLEGNTPVKFANEGAIDIKIANSVASKADSADVATEISRLDEYDVTLLNIINSAETELTEAISDVEGTVSGLSNTVESLSGSVDDIEVFVGSGSSDYFEIVEDGNKKEFTLDGKFVTLANATANNTGLLDAYGVRDYLDNLVIDCGEI